MTAPDLAGSDAPASGPRARSGSSFLSRAGALGLSLVLALGLMEGALRVGFPAQKRHYVWPPGMKKVTRPNPEFMPGVSGDSHFDVNRQGLRGPEMGPDAEHRVLAIGGSTTECLYLDAGEAWPALVGQALPKTRDGRPVWVGNAGKAGMFSRDHVPQLKYLAAEMPRLDTVVVLVGINDVTVALAMGDHYVLPAPVTEPEAEAKQVRRAFSIAPGRLQDLSTDELGPEGAAFYKHTALYQLVKRVRAGMASSASARGLAQDEFGAVYATWRDHRKHAGALLDQAPDLAGPLAEYRRNLGAIADLAAAKHLRLVLMTQPTLWRRDLPEKAVELLWLGGQGDFQGTAGKAYYAVPVLVDTMRRYNEALLQVCRERGLPCLDLAEQIPRETSMFYDDCHFTEAGSQAVAAAVGAHLRALL
jgi:lysophospholipase L1-like esterase